MGNWTKSGGAARAWVLVLAAAVASWLPTGCLTTRVADRMMAELAGDTVGFPLGVGGLIQVSHAEPVFGGPYGVMDSKGRWVLPMEYNTLDFSVDEVIAAERDSVVYLYNYRGRLLGQCEGTIDYWWEDEGEPASMQLVAIRGRDSLVGLADRRGRMVQPCRFERFAPVDHRGNIGAWRGDTTFLLDAGGRMRLGTTRYDYLREHSDGLFVVLDDSRGWGMADADMRELVPCRYRYIYSDHETGYIILADSNWQNGLLDADLNEVFAVRYADISILSPTLFAVQDTTDGPYAIVDRQGRRVGDGHRYARVENGQIVARQKDAHGFLRYGIIDSTGRWLVPPRYGTLWVMDGGRAAGTVRRDSDSVRAYQVVDMQGNVLAEYDYMELNLGCACHPVMPRYIAVQRDGLCGFVDSTLREVIAPRYPLATSSTDDELSVFLNDSTQALVDPTGRVLVSAEGNIGRLCEGVYDVWYSGDDNGLHHYLVTADGRTTATPEQRAAARRDTREDFRHWTSHDD